MYYQRFGAQPQAHAQASVIQANAQASTIFLAKVFNWMAIGLGLTAVTSYLLFVIPGLMQAVFPLMIPLIIGELGLVFFLAARVHKMKAQTATGLFIAYSVLNGITLTPLLLQYTATSVAATFFITAGMFGSMAVYGFITKKDLTKWGSFLFMGLIGMLIAMVVNFFLQSSMMGWMISGIGVIVFTGLTAYDVQKLTQLGASGIMQQGESAIQKTAILGALTLYLDFINLFIMLLHFFGGSRD